MIQVTMREWETLTPDDCPALAKRFLEVDRKPIHNTIQQLSKSGILSVMELRSGLSIESRSYVGRVQLGNLQVTIQPKLDFDPLNVLFRYAYNLRNLKMYQDTEHVTEENVFLDMLINQLIAETGELISRGIHRQYEQCEEQLTSPRGQINIQRIVAQGGIVDATIPCTYYPRSEDTLINQVLLAGLYLAASLTDDLVLKSRLRRLASILAEKVSRIRLGLETMRQLQQQTNRLTAAYEPALIIIHMLLASTGVSIDEFGDSVTLPGFLFDMNKFFETLLSRFLGENLTEYTVHDQYQLRDIFAYKSNHNPNRRRAPTPRPDFVISKGTKTIGIIDAKYRDLWNKSLPRDMLYQLAVYALSQGHSGQATIIYPVIESTAKTQVITIREAVWGQQKAEVILRPVNLVEMSKLIDKKGRKAKREKQYLANRLAFGEMSKLQSG
jgi:5-methylcytosine-specific restriction enzyme subunit McrC